MHGRTQMTQPRLLKEGSVSVYDITTVPKARRYAFIAIFVTAILCVLSQINLSVKGQAIAFLFLPTLGIYLWPTDANAVISIIGVFFLGLFQDYLSFGPTGLWPVTWLALFLLYRPDLRNKTASMLSQFLGAIFVLICIGAFQFALMKFVVKTAVDFNALCLTIVLAIIVFPLFYAIRESLSKLFRNRNSFYYERPAR